MGRFLIFLSYIGDEFCGLAIQRNTGIKTVMGVLEEALNSLRPANQPRMVTSSRTDKGVHALCNSGHVDLQHELDGVEYDAATLTATLNKKMLQMKQDIRVLRTQRVPDEFHCRFNAVSRTYLYRLCISRQPTMEWCLPYPPLEYMRSLLVRDHIDINQMQKAADHLSGVHDFRSFTNPKSLHIYPWLNPVKDVSINICRGKGLLEEHTPCYADHFEHWDITFKAGSFLYKQVRRMTDVLLEVGLGRMQPEEAKSLVDYPGHTHICDTKVSCLPPYGLYIKNVEYLQEDLKFPADPT